MELAGRGIITAHYFVLYVPHFPTDSDFQEMCFNLSSQQLFNTLT